LIIVYKPNSAFEITFLIDFFFTFLQPKIDYDVAHEMILPVLMAEMFWLCFLAEYTMMILPKDNVWLNVDIACSNITT
jgi:hypothetical protein